MLLIPNGVGDYRGIVLVEVVWKLVTVILNLRLTTSIALNNFLLGFWACCGTGTASPKTKLLQQLMAMMEEVINTIFMDMHK